MLFSNKLKSSCLVLVMALIALPGCGEDEKVNENLPKGMARMDGSFNLSKGPASDPVDFVDGKPTRKFDPSAADPKVEDKAKGDTETEVAKGFDVSVADGALNFVAPDSWKKVKPRSSMLEFEIAIPKSDGDADDAADGRLTIMGAGGSVEANLERWYGQYAQPDGGSTKDATKVTETKVGDCDVTWVNMSGTMLDKPGGPMAGGKVVERENYRTLAAIVQAGEHGQYFIKVYGPDKTISDNESAFKAFVESMKINDEAKGL